MTQEDIMRVVAEAFPEPNGFLAFNWKQIQKLIELVEAHVKAELEKKNG